MDERGAKTDSPEDDGKTLGIDDIGEDVEVTRDDRFRFLSQHFTDAIEALRETHDELSLAARELDSIENVWSGSIGGSNRLAADQRDLLKPVFENIPEAGISSNELVDRVWAALKDREWGPEFTLDFIRRIHRTKREPIFHNALLISTVASFESHLAKVAEEYFRAAPEALHKLPKEAIKEFSLRELQDLGSIEEAIELAIDKRVTSLMFGSLADWKRFFSERLNIDFDKLANDWTFVQEVFERRHCLVHNEARASRRYIRNNPKVDLHASLSADYDYVVRAMEALELLGTLLLISVWSKFAIDQQELIDFMENVAFGALTDKRWSFSYEIYRRWDQLPLSQAEKQMAAVNLWIARKNTNGIKSVEEEIRSWDVSGADEIYTFAKLCLLEELDDAFELLPKLVSRGKIGGRELAKWPLIAPLREDIRIEEHVDIMREYLSTEAIQADEDDEVLDSDDKDIQKDPLD